MSAPTLLSIPSLLSTVRSRGAATLALARTGFLCAAACAWLGAPDANARGIAVGGSDFFEPVLAAPAAEFNRDNPAPLALQLTGTMPALADLQADRIALAIVALKPGGAPVGPEFRQVPLAYATVYFAVPEGSAVNQLTLEQVAGIFGSGAGGDSRRWSDLGFTGQWSAKAVSTHAFIAPRSLALELFRHAVPRTAGLRSSLAMHAGWPQLAAQLSSDDGAIALVSAPPPAALKLKLVPLARAAQGSAAAPTPEQIHAGEYPIRLPFVLVFKPARRAEVFEAVRFLLSEEIAEAAARQDLVAVPREARNAALFELESAR